MSIKKIARLAGVSPSTVSRVLNNPDYKCSSEETRDKIWNIAIEMNYLPNQAAQNLRRGKTGQKKKSISLNILMGRTKREYADPFYTELLHAMETEIFRRSCALQNIWYMPDYSDEGRTRGRNLCRDIADLHKGKEQEADGLIVLGKCRKEVYEHLQAIYHGNIVSVSKNITDYPVDEVICDGENVAAMALEYLLSLGHRNIAYVGLCRGESRYRGYQQTLYRHNIDLMPSLINETKQSEEEGYEIMVKYLKMEESPTAFYCASDITAIGMLRCLSQYKNHYYHPSIIGSDDIEQAQYTRPMLSTVRLPRQEMCKFALDLLMDRIHGGHESHVRVELDARLIKRSTCQRVEETVWCEYNI